MNADSSQIVKMIHCLQPKLTVAQFELMFDQEAKRNIQPNTIVQVGRKVYMFENQNWYELGFNCCCGHQSSDWTPSYP